MLFHLPLHIRFKIWRLSLQSRHYSLKKELLIRQQITKRMYDMLANHHYINSSFIHERGISLSQLFYDLSSHPSNERSDIDEWTSTCCKKIQHNNAKDICELVASILMQYVLIIKPNRTLSYYQITKLLDLYSLSFEKMHKRVLPSCT